MNDLESLHDFLATVAPWPPAIESITQRAGRRRTRRRVISASCVAVGIALVGTLAAWSSSTGSQRIHVAGRSPTTQPRASSGSTATTTATLDPSAWITAEVHIDQLTVPQGQEVAGEVVFDNHRDTTVVLPGDGCPSKWAIAVGAANAKPIVAWRWGCGGPDSIRFPPGITSIPFRTRTTYLVCAGQSAIPTPKCLPDGNVPPLPTGRATVWLVTDAPVDHLAIPPPISITIEPRGDVSG